MIDPAQQTTLKAFVLAVAQLEPPIAPEVNAVLARLNQDLQTQPEQALATITQRLNGDAQLERLYDKARRELNQATDGEERDKSGRPGLMATTVLPPNVAAPTQLQKLSKEFAQTVQLINAQVSDPQEIFQERLLVKCAIATKKAWLQDIAILQAIEKRPLTTADLTYRLERPMEQVSRVIDQLWEARKIDMMGSGTLQKMLPFLRSRQHPNPDAYWMLTSLGYFALHPIVSRR